MPYWKIKYWKLLFTLRKNYSSVVIKPRSKTSYHYYVTPCSKCKLNIQLHKSKAVLCTSCSDQYVEASNYSENYHENYFEKYAI